MHLWVFYFGFVFYYVQHEMMEHSYNKLKAVNREKIVKQKFHNALFQLWTDFNYNNLF